MHAAAQGFFVTGSDTGVGKTLCAAALAGCMRAAGLRVAVMKPFETGCAGAPGQRVPRDALLLQAAAACPEPLETICPVALRAPLAPLVAARMEHVHIDLESICEVAADLRQRYDRIVVEGAGGLLVPVAERRTTADLARMLGLPLVVVTRAGLGTINHTLLTLSVARQAGLEVLGVILNRRSRRSGPAERTNPEVLREFANAPLPGTIPFIPAARRRDVDALVRVVRRSLSPDFLQQICC